MKPMRCALISAVPVLTLIACGGGDDDSPSTTKVDELAAGVYTVSTGDVAAPTVGRYYSGAEGRRLLVLNEAQEAKQLYRKAPGGDWIAVPQNANAERVALLQSHAVPNEAVDLKLLAGSYVAKVSADSVATFTVTPAGQFVAGSSTCKLAGTLAPSSLPDALNLSLTATTCGAAVPAKSTGVLLIDRNYAPAVFRLVADDAMQIVDLWAYAE